MKSIAIIVAIHKSYWLPEDDVYLPVQVGDGPRLSGIVSDNTGSNIATSNARYCELTALYWAWKNTNFDYLGLVHYRRYFSSSRYGNPKRRVLSGKQISALLAESDILVPKRRHYVIETLASHYGHTFSLEHLSIAREVIAEKSPEYLNSFDRMLRRRSGHMFNMYIMKRELSDAYCEWLFGVLFELEKRIDFSNLTSFETRMMGRVSELLLDVWLDYHEQLYKEVRWVQLGPVNWPKKITSFLMAKMFHRTYKTST